MRNYRFAFYTSEKTLSRNWAHLIARGAKVHGDTVDLFYQKDFNGVLKDYDGAANLGMARAGKVLYDAYLNSGKHFLYFDKGYHKGNGKYWRVSVDSWQPLAYFQRFMRPGDRFSATKQRLFPRRDTSSPENDVIVFAGACQNYNNFMSLGNINDYNESVIDQIRKHTDRKIVYRPNPSWFTRHNDEYRELPGVELSVPQEPFIQELKRCHLLVVHGTSACLGAMARGVPCMVLGPGIVKSLALGPEDWDKIEQPYWPSEREREQLFFDVAYCQWTHEEYRNGTAWQEVRWALAALEGNDSREPTPQEEVVKQYKAMHDSPRYFRGLTMLKYTAHLEELISKHGVKTMLDYGSGKGEQYSEKRQLDRKLGVTVTCYDPAVPEFCELPDRRRFDMVVCCDVMEHVPETSVQYVIENVLWYARKAAFFAISTTPAKKTLPDGRNCHITIRPPEWWGEQIEIARKGLKGKEDLDVVLAIAEDYGDDDD